MSYYIHFQKASFNTFKKWQADIFKLDKCALNANKGRWHLDNLYSDNDDSEKETTDADMSGTDANILSKAVSVGDKMRKRMYSRSLRDLKHVQMRSKETLEKLNFTINLVCSTILIGVIILNLVFWIVFLWKTNKKCFIILILFLRINLTEKNFCHMQNQTQYLGTNHSQMHRYCWIVIPPKWGNLVFSSYYGLFLWGSMVWLLRLFSLAQTAWVWFPVLVGPHYQTGYTFEWVFK